VDARGRDIPGMRHVPTIREIIGEVFDRFGELTSATIVGDKWPDYYRNIKLIARAFPDAKFLYNVRDPRGVWNSGQTFRDRRAGDKVLANLLEVEEAVRPYLDDGRALTLRYEDLISEPVATMRNVADFLGFEFDPSAIEYDRSSDPFPKRWYWIPEATGDLDVRLTEKWRTEMSAEQQRDVALRCAEFLERYGYPAT
jgi:hypothetical protein